MSPQIAPRDPGRGIGREIALHQALGGAKVAVLLRTGREIDETASLITGRLLRGVDDRELHEQEMEDIPARDARTLRFSGVEQTKL